MQNFQDPHPANAANADAPAVDKLNVIFLKATKATTCYGCSGKFRTAEDMKLGIVPSVPYDIVLTRREHPIFQRKGSPKIVIAMPKDNVYYHAKRNCLKAKVTLSPAIFHIDAAVVQDLSPAHKNHLNSEFRLVL